MSGRSGWYIRGPRKLGLRSMVLNSRMLSGDAEFIEAAREDVGWLVEQVERLEHWKFEALEVMSGLRELGRALGLGLGVQVTGPAALVEVERLTAERDALAARLARVEALAEEWDGDDSCDNRTCVPHRSADALHAALADSDADTTDTQPTDQEDQA